MAALSNKKYGSLYNDDYDRYSFESEIARKYEYEMRKREEQLRWEYEKKLKAMQMGQYYGSSSIATAGWQTTGTTSSTNVSVNWTNSTQAPMPTKTELQKMQDEVEAYCKGGRRDSFADSVRKAEKNIMNSIIAA